MVIERRVPRGVRGVALLLMLGGVAGVAAGLYNDFEVIAASHGGILIAVGLTGIFICVSAWAVWVGKDLWRGRPEGYKFAGILLGVQIPTLKVPGFGYVFYIGLQLTALVSGTAPELRLAANLGSAFWVIVSSRIEEFTIGINVAALVCLLYLARKYRQCVDQQAKPEQTISLPPLPSRPSTPAGR